MEAQSISGSGIQISSFQQSTPVEPENTKVENAESKKDIVKVSENKGGSIDYYS